MRSLINKWNLKIHKDGGWRWGWVKRVVWNKRQQKTCLKIWPCINNFICEFHQIKTFSSNYKIKWLYLPKTTRSTWTTSRMYLLRKIAAKLNAYQKLKTKIIFKCSKLTVLTRKCFGARKQFKIDPLTDFVCSFSCLRSSISSHKAMKFIKILLGCVFN